MKNKAAQTTVSPTVEYLTDILDQITTGTLRVPNFQRPFVWKPDDMIALFESIYNGYPIGSLLFWKADQNYNTLSHIGPYKLKETEELPINYILDGHQRLSTLYGVLTNLERKNNEDNNDYRWDVYYDLKTEEFLHVKGKDMVEPHYFPLKNLLKTTEFIKETRRVFTKFSSEGEKLIEKAEKLLQTFRSYRIAITQIEGGGLDSAVHIFSRLNTKGHQMSIDRMYSALTYKEGNQSFNLSNRIDEIKEQLDVYNFGDIGRMTLFRSILAAAGKNLYTKVKFDLFKENQDIPEIVNNCEKSLISAVKFLKDRIKVPSQNFLPHSLQLIILSEFFRIAGNPSEEKLQIIEKWFWVTSYVGLDIINSSKKRQTLDEVRKFAGIADEEIKDFRFNTVDFDGEAITFPNRFDLNSSRVRVFSIFLSSLNPISLSSYEKIDTSKTLGQNGHKALNYITQSTKYKSKLISNPANRIISEPEERGQIWKYLKIIIDQDLFSTLVNKNEILNSHGISLEATEALIKEDIELFIQLRLNNLINLEKGFMKNKGIIPNKSNITSEVFPDTE